MAVPVESLVSQWADPRWRLSNLYSIVNETGGKVPFTPNSAQIELLDSMHYMNVVLKARQLGFTTFIQLFMLDACMFNSNVRAGTIAHRLEDAKAIFRDKVKFPYDNLPDGLKAQNPARIDSADTLSFANNSEIRVGTSLRSGTFQYLHVSEYGKLCARYPEKAQEVKTGALNTVHAGQIAFIESTAEGQEGHFFDICKEAQSLQRRGVRLGPLDWKFHFFPWWRDTRYRLAEPAPISQELREYFAALQAAGIDLSDQQKWWYASKLRQQGDDMKREYPSTPDEAFAASIEGAYYGREMARIDAERRIGRVPHEPGLLVDTWWDLGMDDLMAIWFVQSHGREVRVIDYYENSGYGLAHYAGVLQEKRQARGFNYGVHLGPHDIKVRELGTGMSRIETAASLGIPFSICPQHDVADGIEATRQLLSRCWFDEEHTAPGVRGLRQYRREWDDARGTWKRQPRHDAASHPADAFRTGAMGWREEQLAGEDDWLAGQQRRQQGRSRIAGY